MTVGNDTKLKIIELLMEDSRYSLRDIASKLDISPTTVGKLVKELEDQGVIQNYTIMVNWEKLGYDSILCLQMAINPGADIEKVGTIIKEIPAIKQVFYTMGETTFSCYAVCKDNKEAGDLIERIGKIEGVEKLLCHTVLKTF